MVGGKWQKYSVVGKRKSETGHGQGDTIYFTEAIVSVQPVGILAIGALIYVFDKPNKALAVTVAED